MTEYCETKEECVQYVDDMLGSFFLKKWPSIIVISLDQSGVFAVHTAIGTELEDTVENTYKFLKTLLNISTETILTE